MKNKKFPSGDYTTKVQTGLCRTPIPVYLFDYFMDATNDKPNSPDQ